MLISTQKGLFSKKSNVTLAVWPFAMGGMVHVSIVKKTLKVKFTQASLGYVLSLLVDLIDNSNIDETASSFMTFAPSLNA